jgi:acetate kinase
MQFGVIKHLSDAQNIQEQLSNERRAREATEVLWCRLQERIAQLEALMIVPVPAR